MENNNNINNDNIFLYFLKNKVLWSNIKKFIPLHNSKPQRYINSLSWISKYKHWSLLEYKLKRNERLADLDSFSFDCAILFLLACQDLELVKSLIVDYDIQFPFSFFPYIHNMQQQKGDNNSKLIFQFLEFLTVERSMNTQELAILQFIEKLLPNLESDKEIIDLLLSKYVKKGTTNLLYRLVQGDRIDLFKYIVDHCEIAHISICDGFLVKSSELERDRLIFKTFLSFGNDKILEYLVNKHGYDNLMTLPIMLPNLVTYNRSQMVFNYLLNEYRKLSNKNDIGNSDSEYLLNIYKDFTNVQDWFKMVFPYDKISNRKEIIYKLLPEFTKEKREELYKSYIKDRSLDFKEKQKIQEILIPGIVVKCKRSDIHYMGFEDFKQVFAQKRIQRISIKYAMKNLSLENLDYLIEQKGVSRIDAKRARGVIIIICRRKDNDITKRVLKMLEPDQDFTFLLKGEHFNSIKYLVRNGFKDIKDFFEPNSSISCVLLYRAYRFNGGIEIIKYIHEHIPESEKLHSLVLAGLVSITDIHVIEYLLSRAESKYYYDVFIERALTNMDRHLLGIVQTYVPIRLIEYSILKLFSEDFDSVTGYSWRNVKSLDIFLLLLEYQISIKMTPFELIKHAIKKEDSEFLSFLLKKYKYHQIQVSDIIQILETNLKRGLRSPALSISEFKYLRIIISHISSNDLINVMLPLISRFLFNSLSITDYLFQNHKESLIQFFKNNSFEKEFKTSFKRGFQSDCNTQCLEILMSVSFPETWRSDLDITNSILTMALKETGNHSQHFSEVFLFNFLSILNFKFPYQLTTKVLGSLKIDKWPPIVFDHWYYGFNKLN